ncbi:probable polygalacturonase At3g15720 [Papaver somniferum]|uniref:probable polygalacturonase At3g15720 n=1 Tax=Papaver somniferum TaxID=3469 RepID=UPI000E6F66A4|nr:probable polygalacturonase At3g15720 [Papaver somniferum]
MDKLLHQKISINGSAMIVVAFVKTGSCFIMSMVSSSMGRVRLMEEAQIGGNIPSECGQKRTEIKIIQSNNVYISNLKFLNSPKKHIFILESTWVYISNVEIVHAPPGSPNTDGIYVSRSSNVYVEHSHIATGDDCISIGPDTSHINVNNIKCGPGKYGKRETIEHVTVKNIELRGTTNGVRIKTWQGGKGYIRDVLFEEIQCIGARNPIIIDQFYCDSDKPCKNQILAVKISNVRYCRYLIYKDLRKEHNKREFLNSV